MATMTMPAEAMPAIFFGHGSPMNALGGPYANAWRALGKTLPRPKAILMVSAHWFVPETAVTAMAHPRTIYDFYGFPKELYEIQYPAPGDEALAKKIAAMLAPLPVRLDHEWGLDHGTWSVAAHVWPDANVPIVQLSIDRTKPADFHYQLGKALAPLREEGVLIAGSGDVVHNLRLMRRQNGIAPYDWASRFNDLVKHAVSTRRHDLLINYRDFGPDAAMAVPTPEHFLPLLYVLAAQNDNDVARFFTDSLDLGSVSMLGIDIRQQSVKA